METLRVYRTPILTLDPDAKAGGGMVEVVKAADAQATIAALQAVIRQMGEQAAVLAKDGMAAKAQVAALQARVRELEQWVQDQSTANLETMRHTDEMQSRALEAEQQLTQRTAELEAVKADTKNMLDVATRRLHEQVNDLQAELERVRGERDEYAHKTKMLCLQNGPLMIENHDMKAELERVSLLSSHNERRFEEVDKKYKELRTLILALPKVEGAVVVSNGYVKDSTRCHALFGADEDAALYAALLQHRQGME